jgi:hypothetical protein
MSMNETDRAAIAIIGLIGFVTLVIGLGVIDPFARRSLTTR